MIEVEAVQENNRLIIVGTADNHVYNIYNCRDFNETSAVLDDYRKKSIGGTITDGKMTMFYDEM